VCEINTAGAIQDSRIGGNYHGGALALGKKTCLTLVLYVRVVAWTFPMYVEGTFCTGVYTWPALGYVYTPGGVTGNHIIITILQLNLH
jgi:hypothetical protein